MYKINKYVYSGSEVNTTKTEKEIKENPTNYKIL
jgi:hypothetical protein